MDRARIKDDPVVRNWERTTPNLDIPTVPVNTFETPKTHKAIIGLADNLVEVVTPSKKVPIRKLEHTAINATTTAVILQEEVRQLREMRKDDIKATKGITMSNDGWKVTWPRSEIIEARGKFRVKVQRKRPRDGRFHYHLKVRSRYLIGKPLDVAFNAQTEPQN